MDNREVIPKSRRKSQKEAVQRYVKKHYHRVPLNLSKETWERWQIEAQRHGYDSLSAFIRDCVENCIKFSDNSDNSVDSNSV